MILQVLDIVSSPVDQDLDEFGGVSEGCQLRFEDNDSVGLILVGRGDKLPDQVEDSLVKFISSNLWGEAVDGTANQIELLLEQPIIGFPLNVVQEEFNVLVHCDLPVLDSVVESSPDQRSREEVLDRVEVLREELGGLVVQGSFHKGVILVVQEESLVIVAAIILHCGLFDRQDEDILHIS